MITVEPIDKNTPYSTIASEKERRRGIEFS
jgi:hypothetical protein